MEQLLNEMHTLSLAQMFLNVFNFFYENKKSNIHIHNYSQLNLFLKWTKFEFLERERKKK